jgi:hypothetical protein
MKSIARSTVSHFLPDDTHAKQNNMHNPASVAESERSKDDNAKAQIQNHII